MAHLRLLTVVGARPQFIKAASLHRAIERATRATHDIEQILVHTGQHYDLEMSQVFFDGLNIPPPQHHLGVGSGTHGEQTGAMLSRLEPVIRSESVDVVIVLGDTNSTLAGALAAAKLGIPVAHVEAGLRSFDKAMPEELNRVLTDHLSTHLFVPSEQAIRNLSREGLESGVKLSGDLMHDILLDHRAEVTGREDVCGRYGLQPDGYALATVHRAANTDQHSRLREVFEGLGRVARRMPVLIPLHPRTRAALESRKVKVDPGIRVVSPVGYKEMLALQRHAHVILTDSGGVQKEAYWLGVPCVTLRRETEWPETLEGGWNVLVGVAPGAIELHALRKRPQGSRGSPYGSGNAADVIISALLSTNS